MDDDDVDDIDNHARAYNSPLPYEHAISQQSIDTTTNKTVQEYQFLLEKSLQLFAGLRELPTLGGQRLWQPYFQRTFEVYTKLWKYQQQHRDVLEDASMYGLKRWEIGEIASKVGQLYYHYYLRTGETNYLHEAYVFYEAIRERDYFKINTESISADLAIKNMRYLARFVVVSVLMNNFELVSKLTESLKIAVDHYAKTFKAVDVNDWNAVVQEIVTFLSAVQKSSVVDSEKRILSFSARINKENGVQIGRDIQKLRLQEAVVVGLFPDQVKFSELTLDIYRMLQTLERESSLGSAKDGSKTKRLIPKKHLLFRPSIGQLFTYLSSSYNELSHEGAMLLYVSAHARLLDEKGDKIGLAMDVKQGDITGVTSTKRPSTANYLTCDDLMPYTRKPLFLIIESSKSFVMPANPYGQPVLCMTSPVKYGERIDRNQMGGLFTLFLCSPLHALCVLCGVEMLDLQSWQKSMALLQSTELAALTLFISSAEIYDYLGRLIIRYVICHAFMSRHIGTNEMMMKPSMSPALPSSLLNSPDIYGRLQFIVETMGIHHLFGFDTPKN